MQVRQSRTCPKAKAGQARTETVAALGAVESRAMDKKITFARLDLELTRRCNLACRHCYNGAAQDVDITRAMLDRLLNQTAEIGQLIIKGGETLLNVPMLEYLVNRIIARKIPVHYFGMVTNGTKQSVAVCKAINRMACHIARSRCRNTYPAIDKAGNRQCAVVTVSNDRWHKECNYAGYDPDTTVKLFKRYANSNVYVNYHEDAQAERGEMALLRTNESLGLCGRAADNKLTVFHYMYSFQYHRITVLEDRREILCGIHIAANGNIGVTSHCVSYDDFDRTAAGNLADMTVWQAVERWNKLYPYSCSDARRTEIDAGFAVNKGVWFRGNKEFVDAKMILLNAWNEILQRRRIMAFCPLEDDELETVMDSIKQGRPERYGEELIALHNDAVEHGIAVEPMRRIDVAQKDTIVTAILNNKA